MNHPDTEIIRTPFGHFHVPRETPPSPPPPTAPLPPATPASSPHPTLPPPSAPSRLSPLPSPSAASAPAFTALQLRLVLVALGLLCLGLSRLAPWLRPGQTDVFSLWAMLGLALAALPVLWDALTSLKADGFHATRYYMDQFVALAILACFATGQYATGTIVAAILIVGQMLEEHSTLGVEEAVKSLLRLSRVKARRLRVSVASAREELVDASALVAGDRVRLLPGEIVPADGVIRTGVTTLDQASITGESLPVDAGPGAAIYAGTVNLTGSIEFNVARTGADTVIGRVTSIVEEAKNSRAPLMRLIDDYTRYYMPLVLLLAGFVLFFTHDVSRAIAVIIVAMPCAFVLASPTAMVAALAVASRLGVLVKSSRHFEAATAIDTVVFDKTGTLTTGRLRVVDLSPTAGVSEPDLLAAAAALESHSTHPIARAVTAAAEESAVPIRRVDNIAEVPGQGLRGGGLTVGRRSWLIEQGIAVPEGAGDSATASTLCIARDEVFIGAIFLADVVRPETPATLAQLRALGVDRFVMLTGDRPAVAARIAGEIGLTEFRAECLPEQKLREVEALKAAGRRVLVVGDGVNDGPALAAGDLSIALGALGSDVAIQTADVALMGNDLRHVQQFLALSDRTLRLINQNLLWGLGSIAVFIALSAFGLVSPIAAAVLHECGAFFVIFNSARLLRYDPAETDA